MEFKLAIDSRHINEGNLGVFDDDRHENINHTHKESARIVLYKS